MSAAGARAHPENNAGLRIVGLDLPGVVECLDLRVADGEAVSILGLGRDARTRLLRAVAGLDPSRGSVRVDEVAVDSLPAGERPVAMVFRDLALYPHLDVRANIAFPLRYRHRAVSRDEMRERIAEVAADLGLQPLLESMPDELAPAQRLCAALARAVVWRPRVLVFDDAFPSLPSSERPSLRAMVRHLQRSWRLTTIYGLDDGTDAMVLSDRIAFFADGRLQQIDTPQMLYSSPATVAAAAALGVPPINWIDAVLDAGAVQIGDQRLDLRGTTPGGEVVVGVRPEAFSVTVPGAAGLVVRLEPESRETLGGTSHFRGHVGAQAVSVILPGSPRDVPLRAYAPASALLLFDRHTGKRLG